MTKLVRALGLSLALVAFAGLMGPPFAVGQAKKDKDTKTGASVFVVHKSEKNGKFYFTLRDSDGTLLALSSPGGFETKLDCQKAIETIRNTAAKAKVEFKIDATDDKKAVDKKTEDKKKK
ncbi:MAG TPA: DUF1508 domain-containing protein, partial [Gemmataceae bacterium]